jgi:hypothetical protein
MYVCMYARITPGLYIRNRNGDLVKGGIPPTHLAFQIGETTQIHTGGILQVGD